MKEENYYNQIKDILIENEVYKKVKDYSKNKHDLESYYNVGKLLIEAQGGEARSKYGDGLIKKYSKKLTKDLKIKYDYTSLSRMRQFYLLFKNVAHIAQLSWSHYQALLPLKNIDKINYYIDQCIKFNLGRDALRERIKQKEYERLPDSTKSKLITNDKLNINDFVKNPIIIKSNNKEVISEKVLHQLILENIESFLCELGEGFSFIGSEYKIKLGNNYNYIDLLLFNIKYNCYVVVELKVTELKKEHIGQIETYMNYIDKKLKTIYQDKTIGIIICRVNNQYIIEYSSDRRIISREFQLKN